MSKVIDKDRGYKKIMSNVKKADCWVTAVGYPGEKFSGDNARDNIAERAATHEYGTRNGKIPSRPFMRQSFENNSRKISKRLAMEYDKVIIGKQSTQDGLSRVGEFMVGIIKATIRRGDFKPLRPRTILRKGSSKPLIDTGEMRNSTTHVERKM